MRREKAPSRIGGRSTVAVAIACYNQGRYLNDAIESVLEQTRKADQIIVVDDGSTDETRSVAEQYRSVLYHYQENAGLSAARNTGLRLARTQRILFLDADDMLEPNALECAMRRMDALAGAAFVYGGFREIDSNGATICERRPCDVHDQFDELLRGNHIAMHGTVIYDASLLRDSGGFDESLNGCEDYDVLLRLARDHEIASYPIIAARYRRHMESMSRDSVNMIKASRTVLLRHAKRRGLPPEKLAAARIGLHFMTKYYQDQAAETLVSLLRARRRAAAASFALGWLRSVPGSGPRILRAVARYLLRDQPSLEA